MSVAALFTIVRRWKQINVPNGGIDKEYVAHIYNGILPTLKKEQNNAMCATWMNLEIVILSEV